MEINILVVFKACFLRFAALLFQSVMMFLFVLMGCLFVCLSVRLLID